MMSFSRSLRGIDWGAGGKGALDPRAENHPHLGRNYWLHQAGLALHNFHAKGINPQKLLFISTPFNAYSILAIQYGQSLRHTLHNARYQLLWKHHHLSTLMKTAEVDVLRQGFGNLAAQTALTIRRSILACCNCLP